jgi:cell division protein FtsL
MMMDNAARVTQTEIPASKPQAKPQPQAVPVHKTRVRFSPLEKLLSCTIGLVVLGFAVATVFAQVGVIQTQHSFHDTQVRITKVNTGIANFQQAVSELTDSSRLNAFAKAHGLTVIEGSVKQAVK